MPQTEDVRCDEEQRRPGAKELKERVKQINSLSTMSKEETLRMRLQHVGPSVTLFFQENPLKIVQGRGQYLYDELGNEYLDCINNVAHVGHGNPRVAEAVGRQLHLLNTNSRFLHDNLSLYANRLTALFPAHLSVCYLVNSGSEANDLAIRLARAYTKRKDIVSVDGAYHGNLTSTMAISPYKTDKIHGHKQAKWAHVAPLPCLYRGKYAPSTSGAELTLEEEQKLGLKYGQETEQMIERAKAAGGREVAAFFVESMISCGGQFPLPSGYLRHMQKYLRQQKSLLVCDEVQTGFGRSGKRMWAFQLDGDDIEPDIVTIGKPMGNGFPIAAVVTRPEVAQAFAQIGTEYFNTFGGNPASCAAALAVLDELEERQLMRQADRVGSYILEELRAIQRSSKIIGDVRGFGYFIGLELVENLRTKQPAPEYAKYLVGRFRDERILMSTEGKLGNVLKFKPPMVFQMNDAQRFVSVLAKSIIDLELKLINENMTTMAVTRNLGGGGERQHRDGGTSSPSSSSRSSCSSSSWLESSVELDE